MIALKKMKSCNVLFIKHICFPISIVSLLNFGFKYYHFFLWDYHVVFNGMGARDFKFSSENCSILSFLKDFELRLISNNGLKT